MVKVTGYQKRFYRDSNRHRGLEYFTVTVKETDLLIAAQRPLIVEAREAVLKYRNQLENYIEKYPVFKESLIPLPYEQFAPAIVKDMMQAAEKAGVGPMASVAGAIAECVGRDLLHLSKEIIIENGGDLFLSILHDTLVEIYAGNSFLSGRLALKIKAKDTPLGVCTSSGTVGHSKSFGTSDAVTIVSNSAALADAAATAVGNVVHTKQDIGKGLEQAQAIDGVRGVLIIKDHKLGVWGDIELKKISGQTKPV
jgi:ApbE superfamily uncharacterized protein (UPF0280 family)